MKVNAKANIFDEEFKFVCLHNVSIGNSLQVNGKLDGKHLSVSAYQNTWINCMHKTSNENGREKNLKLFDEEETGREREKVSCERPRQS